MEALKKHGGTFLVVLLASLTAMAIHQKYVAPHLAPKAKV